jgi:hypothetical protein
MRVCVGIPSLALGRMDAPCLSAYNWERNGMSLRMDLFIYLD